MPFDKAQDRLRYLSTNGRNYFLISRRRRHRHVNHAGAAITGGVPSGAAFVIRYATDLGRGDIARRCDRRRRRGRSRNDDSRGLRLTRGCRRTGHDGASHEPGGGAAAVPVRVAVVATAVAVVVDSIYTRALILARLLLSAALLCGACLLTAAALSALLCRTCLLPAAAPPPDENPPPDAEPLREKPPPPAEAPPPREAPPLREPPPPLCAPASSTSARKKTPATSSAAAPPHDLIFITWLL